MSPDLAAAMPPQPARRRAGFSDARKVLDGEVIPPTIRVVNPEPPRPSASETPRASYRRRLNTALIASSLAFAFCAAGAAAAYKWTAPQVEVAVAKPDPTMLALLRVQDELKTLKASVDATQTGDGVRALKKSVDTLKAEFDGLRSSNQTSLSQINARLDKPEPASNTADILARIDKLDHDPKLADIASRLDRIEHQVSSSMPTGSIAQPMHTVPNQTIVPQTIGAPAPKALPKPATLDNWIVRDVYAGIALVEGRSGSIREVAPGEFLPGAGEVRSIERRGRAWIVVTSRGIIDNETW